MWVEVKCESCLEAEERTGTQRWLPAGPAAGKGEVLKVAGGLGVGQS